MLVVELIVEAVLDQRPEIRITGRWIGFYAGIEDELINRALDIGKIILVKLLIGPQSGAIQVLDSDIVTLGYSDQRVDKGARFEGLAGHQLDHLSWRNAEQVKRKVVQRCRAEKAGQRAELLIKPD